CPKRFGVVLLRFLGPGSAPQFNAELLAARTDRARVGYAPWQEQRSDLPFEQRREGRTETRPCLEVTLRQGPKHPMDPGKQVGRRRVDNRRRSRIGPRVVQLPPEREVRKRGSLTEQVGPNGKVAVQSVHGVPERLLNLRRRRRTRANKKDAPDHPLTHSCGGLGELG